MKKQLLKVFFNGFDIVVYQKFEDKWVQILDNYTLRVVWKSENYSLECDNEKIVQEAIENLKQEFFK